DSSPTWISIHWFSRAGPTAAEPRPDDLSSFPKDLLVFHRSWMEGMGNIVFYNEHPDGGHSAAYERPQYLVSDVR
ncbi:hypothetical protein FB45DRAFT_686126, partial [Roridomyces roridus]